MSDVNEPSQTVGRGTLGGNPAGVVTGETFAWWREQVETHPDHIVVSAHHYMLKNTTVASGDWEGVKRDADGHWQSHYHGYKPQGAPIGASYLYFVDSRPDSGAIEQYLESHPGSIDLWLGGHTHTHPDDTHGGKSHVETKWGGSILSTQRASVATTGRRTYPKAVYSLLKKAVIRFACSAICTAMSFYRRVGMNASSARLS